MSCGAPSSEAPDPVTIRIITEIADEKGIDQAEMPPLYDTVDPNALENLFRDGSGKVTFEYADHIVEVDHRLAVEVTPFNS